MKHIFGKRRQAPPADDCTAGSSAASDYELLERFLKHRDDRAFAVLVARHGQLTMSVCRRSLCCEQDAEDAFQATFLVLARKAGTVRKAGSLSAWLYQTAYRISLRARTRRARRRELPLEDLDVIAPETLARIACDYQQSVVDEELNRLPERYRLPVFLCCVEGQSVDEAATQLGWSFGSVKGRLERGRQELRRRLMLRRVSPLVGMALVATLPTAATAAPVSASLIASTVQAGMQFAAGQTALGYVSQNSLTLAQRSLSMSITTKVTACSLLLAGALTVGGGGWALSNANGAGRGSDEVIQGQTVAATLADAEGQFALAAEGERRDGDKPKAGPRDGDAPRTGPRDGDRRPAEGAGVRRDAEGTRRGGEGERNPLQGFTPQNQREAVLYQMILSLQAEVTSLRAEIRGKGGAADYQRPDARRPAAKDGDAPRREGEVRKDGDAPRREGEARKDGDAPRREGERKDGDAPKREG